MTPTFTAPGREWSARSERGSTIVPELELDSKVLAAKQRDRFLQIVARWRGDAHLISLDGGLNFLELGVFDGGGDSLGGLAVERELEGDFAPNCVAAGGLDFPRIEIFHGDAALYELRLKHVPQRIHLVG